LNSIISISSDSTREDLFKDRLVSSFNLPDHNNLVFIQLDFFFPINFDFQNAIHSTEYVQIVNRKNTIYFILLKTKY
jgi:hypothetical protein